MWNAEEEARRLRARFDAVPNKAAWAKQHKLPGGASMLSQHIHGHRPIGMDAAICYAAGFGVPLSAISQRLAAQKARADLLNPSERDNTVLLAQERRPDDLGAALRTLRAAIAAAPASSQSEVRVCIAAIVEGIDVDRNIARLADLLSGSSSPRKRHAA